MMDAGYFVGRKEVVDWINETLKLSLTKVEQTASGAWGVDIVDPPLTSRHVRVMTQTSWIAGAVACQLLDSIYPGKVLCSAVNPLPTA
jgi:hypothetical protein